MYKFINVNKVSGSDVLPSEALRIDGEYIENLIPGYRTLHVTGREALSPELSTYETGARDGSTLKSKRYPARTIIVTYQLIAGSNEEFREAYNQLAAILDVQNVTLRFKDEPDKYYKGTPSKIGEVQPGTNAVIGEIEFLCVDPFKYSVTEHEAMPDGTVGDSVLINYEGTYRAFPTIEATFPDECGYIAFFNEEEKILQMGDPDETDTETYQKSQRLAYYMFNDTTSWNDATEADWLLNSYSFGNKSLVGAVGAVPSSYNIVNAANTSGTLLKRQKQNDSEKPVIYYTVSAKTSNRTANTVKVAISVTAALAESDNYFGRGFGLKGSVYIGGEWHDVTLKTTTDYWKGNSGHTKSLSVTVSGLAADDTSIGGIKFKATRTDNTGGKTGVLDEVTCNDLKISAYTEPTAESYFLGATSYGAGNSWHGASITHTLPADAAEDKGAKNFVFTTGMRFAPNENEDGKKEYGVLSVNALTESGASLVCVRFTKSTVGRGINAAVYLKGSPVWSKTVTNKEIDALIIKKVGSKVTITCGDLFSRTFTSSAIGNLKAGKINYEFLSYGTKPEMTYNGISAVRFIKNNCDTWEDIPNKFAAGDELAVNCKLGTVRQNGALTPELGALGNDWEEFYLEPGLNQIGFAYSSWVPSSKKPKIKVKYREVFL